MVVCGVESGIAQCRQCVLRGLTPQVIDHHVDRAGGVFGAVSKQVQRLVEAGLVRREAVPGNRKEVALSLTADGEAVASVHRAMHDEANRVIEEFLSRYTEAELATVAKILRDLLNTDRRGLRLVIDTDR